MIRTLDKYLLRSFLINYVLALSVLISLYVSLDLFANIDEFTEAGKPIRKVVADVVDYYAYNIPMYFAQLAGVITLFAGCATFARLHRNNEITAVLASGTSLYRLATPLVLAGLAMNFLLFLDHEVILPAVAPKLARERDDVEGLRTYEIWCVRDGDRRLISAQALQPKQQQIRGLIVVELSTEAETLAQMGDVVTADYAQWDAERKGWKLDRGRRIREARAGETGFEEGDLVTEPEPFYPCDLTPEDLRLRKLAQWTRFLSLRDLARLERRGDADSTQIAQVRHGRFTLPIDNMILLVLGLVFFMTRLPSSVLTQGAKALAVCSVAFLVTFIGQQAVGSADVNPALPAWLPVFIFGPLAVVLLDNVKT